MLFPYTVECWYYRRVKFSWREYVKGKGCVILQRNTDCGGEHRKKHQRESAQHE